MSFTLANIDNRAALVDDQDNYYDLATISGGTVDADPMTALAHADALHMWNDQLEGIRPTGALAGVELGAPVPRPRNCFGIGLNYQSHAAESEMELPENPLVFTKFPSCVVGP